MIWVRVNRVKLTEIWGEIKGRVRRKFTIPGFELSGFYRLEFIFCNNYTFTLLTHFLTQNKIYFLVTKSGKWCTFYSYRGLRYIIVNYFYYYYSADMKLVINYNTTHNAQRAWYCSCTYIRFITHLQKDDVLLMNRYIRNQKNSVTKKKNIFPNR